MSKRTHRRSLGDRFEGLSEAVTRWTGSTRAFMMAFGIIVAWALLGPVFRFSDTWQLVINTGTTIVTFLMVFLIQRSQNKDSLAIHLKLNELVAAIHGASNRLISAEDLTEHEVKILTEHFRKLAELARQEEEVTCSHSIEEAEAGHARKRLARAARKLGKEIEEEIGVVRKRRRRKKRQPPEAGPNNEPTKPQPA